MRNAPKVWPVMDGIKVVSFDVEGTLVTPDFSYAIWFEAIPRHFADRKGTGFEEARRAVEEEYRKVGDQRLEWYDIQYWFDKLDLGIPDPVMEGCQSRVCYYPEVREVLSSLSGIYKLTVASGSAREFLRYLLRDIEPYFARVFSSVSDYRRLKTPEFYRKMCAVLGVEPTQVVHVGDNWQFDCVAPGEVGIHAFYLDRKRQGDHENSLASLTQLKAHLSG